MSFIAENIVKINALLKKTAENCARDPNEITLLAVSKTKSVDDIKNAIDAGQHCFGENYVQESVEKIQQLQSYSAQLTWHFIGPIQSNKTRLIAENFDWVHTVEREKIAERLNAQRPSHLAPLNVLIQVNINQETSKSGIELTEVATLATQIATLPHLTLRGLMTIPDPYQSEAELRATFQQMKHLFDELKQQHQHIDTLSMGMSHDFEIAIEEGSTLIRVGQAIFGERH